ncbi:anhydro-N-acetylmuramic acid kinase [Nitrosomonadaceae bacterium]|nr:anhydro-N-acetylmuramic acid kinase [Nitrosomonadaceae bacterium]
MSGTSLDGIDVILSDSSTSLPSLACTYYLPYDKNLRQQILELHQPGNDELHRAAVLSNELARSYAEAVVGLLTKSGVSPQDVIAIGCHGQTVRHCPQPERSYTLQLGNAALLAELTGITVVSDFRSRDIAAGGQGAPLVPKFHQFLFTDPKNHRVIVNIGGISNLTSLTPSGEVAGFDCGPGNLLMDAWCLRHLGETYDHDGAWARSGKVIPELFERLFELEFFSLPFPKSTGRELFNLSWLEGYLSGMEKPEDVQSTLSQLTTLSIAKSLLSHFPSAVEVFLCGGGARNTDLVERLRAALPMKRVELTDVLGVDADWLEAFAFAWLAQQAMVGAPGNLPEVTGARGQRILGAIYQA